MEMDWLEEALQDCMWDDEYAKEEKEVIGERQKKKRKL